MTTFLQLFGSHTIKNLMREVAMTLTMRKVKMTRRSLSLWSVFLALLSSDPIKAFEQSNPLPTRFQSMALALSLDRNSDSPISVALTREEGKNAKLLGALETDNCLRMKIDPLELPCIIHADGPDLAELKDRILAEPWDYIVVTSPEAAKVLASACEAAQMSSLKVAAVGKATEKALVDSNIQVMFTPSKAYASCLAEELPGSAGCRVLYPASCRAPGTVADGLAERGITVVRLNTYDTISAVWSESQKEKSRQCRIVCFASPSSVRGWLENTNNNSVAAACIGKTSAKACQEAGWDEANIYYTRDSPGIDGWVDSIRNAVDRNVNVASA